MPYENEHACDLTPSGKYSTFRRKNCDRRHDGKCIDVVYGKKKTDGKMEDHSYRYSVQIWDTRDARAHCKSKDGKFETATGEKAKGQINPLIADAANKLKISENNREIN